MFQRLVKLINEDNLSKLKNTKILLVGIGGVGGYALEALIRSGFSNITIVDGDNIDVTNLNRQIISNINNIGNSKVKEASDRCININKEANIIPINKRLTKENFNEIIKEKYDYIIDACDDISIKLELIRYANGTNTKIIVCLGMGRKLDATKLEVTRLDKTYNDPVAKKLRHELSKEGIDKNIPVVFSREVAIKTEGDIGSAIFVPAIAGILLANYVFNDIIEF